MTSIYFQEKRRKKIFLKRFKPYHSPTYLLLFFEDFIEFCVKIAETNIQLLAVRLLFVVTIEKKIGRIIFSEILRETSITIFRGQLFFIQDLL